MPGGGGGSQPPAGASGTGTGPSANVYTPMNQPGTDAGLTNLLSGIYGPALAGLPQQTPASQIYPQAQQYDPYQAAAGQNLVQQTGDINSHLAALGGANQVLYNAFDPIYASALSQLESNPFFSQTMAGAQQGAGIGQQGATQGAANSAYLSGQIPQFAQYAAQAASAIPQVQGLAQQTAALAPQMQGLANASLAPQGNIYGLAGQVASPMQGLQQAGQSVWNTAQDPQNALYNRTLNQVEQQQNAQNAMSGVAGTPYGAGIAGDATRNFNIDWQNQQLARQAQGAQSLGAADTQAAGLGQTAGGLYQAGSGLNAQAGNLLTGAGALNQGAGQLYGTGSQMATQAAAANALGGQAANTALGLDTNAANLAAQSGALPQQAFQANLQSQVNAANARLGAGVEGAQGLGSLLGAQATGLGQGSAVTNNALLNQQNLGNQQYLPAQQAINDAESYLGLGQAASGLSGQLGQLGVNQNTPNYAAIGQGLGVGSSLLFGNQGLSGLTGGAGLLGGGSAASTLGAVPAFSGGDAALGADLLASDSAGAAAAGGGFDAASLLPAAALS